MITYQQFTENLQKIRDQIAEAAGAAGRSPDSVELLPVTKFHPLEAVRHCAQAGLDAVGENRVQEAIEKQSAADPAPPLRWELIGHLQSNKAKLAVAHFDRIQSVDSFKLIDKLAAAAADHGKRLFCLLQVNTGEDPAKFGFRTGEAEAAVTRILTHPSLHLEGLMTIAPLDDNPAVARQAFARLRQLRDRLQTTLAHPLPTLSMGMTSDLTPAIAEGSTQIRVGTALFGPRP